jgi:hypothetical protein
VPLQNRVTPFGEIVALPGRGLVFGNRGILHDDDRHIVRSFQVRRWIACRLQFRGIRRTLMRPHSYTELFFLDEATAFSAGHRPCAECRRDDYRRFRALWEARHGDAGADSIDRELHAHRIARRQKRTYVAQLAGVPDGVFVALDGDAQLVWNSGLLQWSDAGYTQRTPRPARATVEVLTPRPIVELFHAGYVPEVHPSAKSPIGPR